MIRTELQGLWQLLRISAVFLVVTTAYALLFFAFEERMGDRLYSLPGQLGSVFGLAVAFFLGFRMNSAYDRWWEARKILGELTNGARSFGAKTRSYFGNPDNLVELTAEQRASRARGAAIEKSDLMNHINRFYDVQGKAERIRNTPFLKIYAAFTRLVVSFYVLLLPFFVGDIDLGGEGSRLEILMVPVVVLISTAFLTINSLANRYAEPFSGRGTSVRAEDIRRTILADCAELRSKIRAPGREQGSSSGV